MRREWNDPNLKAKQARLAFARVPALCGIIMNEPGYAVERGWNLERWRWDNMKRFERPSAPFWRAFDHTVLLVRDPFERFLSHMAWRLAGCPSRPRSFSCRTFRTLDDLLDLGNASYEKLDTPRCNYLAQHLHPTLHRAPRAGCTAAAARTAAAAVDLFSLVLNLPDLTAQSLRIARARLGLDLSAAVRPPSKRSRTHWREQPLRDAHRAAFWSLNRCDAAVIARANHRVMRLAAQV